MGNQMFQYAYLHAQMRKGEIPDIYVQSPEYFEGFEDEIKQIFRQGVPDKKDAVAIHVRRGDYVNNPFYVDLFAEGYYERAMAEFPNKKFIVFSDDVEWCKKQEIFKDAFVSNLPEVFDFNDMAACSGHIIANSSFSWWAAFISPYTEKVVAPKAWYTDGVGRTKVPESWIRI